jgi:hypothetical protein
VPQLELGLVVEEPPRPAVPAFHVACMRVRGSAIVCEVDGHVCPQGAMCRVWGSLRLAARIEAQPFVHQEPWQVEAQAKRVADLRAEAKGILDLAHADEAEREAKALAGVDRG